MAKKANIKLDSESLEELKRVTGEATGQKAVEHAVIYLLREARQRDILNFLKQKRFTDEFDPVSLRTHER